MRIKEMKRGQIRNRVSIDKGPYIVAQKTCLGDWEIDTVIGHRTIKAH